MMKDELANYGEAGGGTGGSQIGPWARCTGTVAVNLLCPREHFERVEAFIAAVTSVVDSAGRCVE